MRNPIRLLALIAALVFSGQLLAQQGNARGTIGESPYNVVRGWAKPFQDRGFRTAVSASVEILASGQNPQNAS